jgi:hypothetical protein
MKFTRLYLFLAALLCAPDLPAQSVAGRLSGNITDPSGAAVPAVRVTAVNADTGQKIAERAVTIDISESVVRNFRLQVGAITQSVSVSADIETLQTDSPAAEATIVRRAALLPNWLQ